MGRTQGGWLGGGRQRAGGRHRKAALVNAFECGKGNCDGANELLRAAAVRLGGWGEGLAQQAVPGLRWSAGSYVVLLSRRLESPRRWGRRADDT
jgi:hypothetical protein